MESEEDEDTMPSGPSGNYNVLARFARIGKLYKLIRMTRLAKLFKMFKRKNVLSQFTAMMKISSGLERLVFFSVFVVFFFHLSSCLFVILAQFEFSQRSWLYTNNITDLEPNDQYVASVYFMVTTLSTVGYGDIAANTIGERVFCIIIMLVGVFTFTFVSGALSSIISNFDAS